MSLQENEGASAGQGPSKAKVFISYSRKDQDFADRLDTALKAQGFATLIDRSDIYEFEDWRQRIQGLVTQADTIVFIISPDALASDECRREVDFAASLNKRLAPVVYRRAEGETIPEGLARLNFLYFDRDDVFDEALSRLCDALETDIDWVRQHTAFGEQARPWAEAGRPGPGGLLLRSPTLEEAEQWIASRPRGAPAPTEDTRAFVSESRRAASRRRNILTGGLAAGLLVALVLAGFAFWQRSVAVTQEKIAKEQRDRATAQEQIAKEQRDRALLSQSQFLTEKAGIDARHPRPRAGRPDRPRSPAGQHDRTRSAGVDSRRFPINASAR